MKTFRTLFSMMGVCLLVSCNNNAPQNETNPGAGDMQGIDTHAHDHSRLQKEFMDTDLKELNGDTIR